MSTWTGWPADLLDAAGLPNTRLNRSFLTAWSKSQPTPCTRNPLFISHREPGSTNCRKDTRTGIVARNYDSIDSGKAAFAAQIHSPAYSNLLAALETGNPYSVEGTAAQLAAQEIGLWGSHAFAQTYFRSQASASGHVSAPQALKGWKDLRRSVNRGMPFALDYAQRTNSQTLRNLRRARKVRI